MDLKELNGMLLDLVISGVLLSKCPHCDMFLSAPELEKSKCTTCDKKFERSAVRFIARDSLAQC